MFHCCRAFLSLPNRPRISLLLCAVSRPSLVFPRLPCNDDRKDNFNRADSCRTRSPKRRKFVPWQGEKVVMVGQAVVFITRTVHHFHALWTPDLSSRYWLWWLPTLVVLGFCIGQPVEYYGADISTKAGGVRWWWWLGGGGSVTSKNQVLSGPKTQFPALFTPFLPLLVHISPFWTNF